MPQNNSRVRRTERREAAEKRQQAWDALTVDEKLARLEARGQDSTVEYDTLLRSKGAA